MEQEKKYFDLNYIKDFQEGDDTSFEIIYEYYKQHIYYMGMQLFNHDAERSKDLVQNTFSEIYMNIKKLKAPEAFYVWMNQIAYRQGCNMLRYQSKDSSYYMGAVEEDFIDYVPDHKQEDAISTLQRKDAIEIILEELKDMDEDKRLVGYLRYFEELSIKEINEITGISENTVMSHLHRLKAKLKKKLEAKGFTSSTCLSLLLVPNLFSYYKAFVEIDEPMEEEGTNAIRERAKQQEVKKKNIYWNYVAKIITRMVVVIPVLTIAGVSVYNASEKNNVKLPIFTSVEYDTSLRNQPLPLKIKTSNRNYDNILLNDTTNLIVFKNGTYTLSLIKDSEIVDKKEIVIKNIDRDIPEVVKQEIQGNNITFYLQDDLSGVNFDGIGCFLNGVSIEDYQSSATLGKITVPYDKNMNGYLEIPDNVGNLLKVNINSYTITTN
ncbi:MAG: RNA polymerase sigma factor [Longicatena sp.]